jgi:hypothetical protein
MRSAKKSTKILSALSMAAVSVIGAKAAHAQATLNLYYGQDTTATNSNNGIIVGTGFNATGFSIAGTKTNATGGIKYIKAPTEQTVSQTGPTTITVPVGDYLSLAIDALLTGNPNPDAGINSNGTSAQPAYLGLSELSLGVNSTDSSASILTPISTDAPSQPLSSFNGQPTYHSTTVLNSSQGSPTANTDHLTPNSSSGTGYNVVPNWGSLASADPRADVQPNIASYDAGHGNGNVGLNGYSTGGNTAVTSTSAQGIATLEQFASSNNTANYASATDYFNSLVFQGLTAGTVTLTPNVVLNSSAYWQLASHGTNATVSTTSSGGTSTHNGTASTYQPHTMTTADKVNNAPSLVIVVSAGTSTTSTSSTSTTSTTSSAPKLAVVALEATADTNYGTTITNGTGATQGTFSPASTNTLTLTGGNGKYNIAQVTGINSNMGVANGNTNVSGWNPTSDSEIFGVDVKVNGVNATPSQLATLLAAINGTDTYGKASNVTASLTDPNNPQVLAALDTGTTSYNLFLTFAGGQLPGSASDNLGIDLAADPALAGYSFSAVAVVPEPVSLGLLAVGGLGLMTRRHRRKA